MARYAFPLLLGLGLFYVSSVAVTPGTAHTAPASQPSARNPNGEFTPKTLYDSCSQEWTSLRLGDPSLTGIQAAKALAAYKSWFEQQRFIGKVVTWRLTLDNVWEDAQHAQDAQANTASARRDIKAAEEALRGPVGREDWFVKQMKDLIEASKKVIADEPYSVIAMAKSIDPQTQKAIVVTCHVHKSFANSFGNKGSEIFVTGTVEKLSWIFQREDIGVSFLPTIAPSVDLRQCKLLGPPTTRPAIAPTPAVVPSVAPAAAGDDESKATALLKMAENYIACGMKPKAQDVLKELLAKYPKTQAAAKAQALAAPP